MSARIIAHRGAPLYQLENTIESFEKAISLGVDMIELDVRVTRDGHPIVFHDTTIDRLTEGTGLIKIFSLSDLEKIKVGSYRIPTVEEVVYHFGDKVRINFDVKVLEAVEPLKKIITKHSLEETAVISSFYAKIVREFEIWRPSLDTGLLCWYVSDMVINFAIENKIDFLHPFFYFLNKRIVNRIHKHKLEINTWTIDNRFSINRAIDLGIDGIITNNPVLVQKLTQKKLALQ